MLNFNIKNYSKAEDKLFLRQPNSFYIFFLIIFLLLASGLLIYSFDIVPVILTVISFILLTYREEWKIDKKLNSLSYIRGALFIYKKNAYSLDDIETVELSSFIKGKKEDNDQENLPFYFKKYYSLKIFFKNGDDYTIVTEPVRNKDKIDEVYNFIK